MSLRTPETQAREALVAEWLKAHAAIGTQKDLARKLGVSYRAVQAIISRLRYPIAARSDR